jgi:hypothetical protein
MSANRLLPPLQEILKLVEKGMTHAQIAEMVSASTGELVSRSSVSAALSRADKTNRIRYERHLPWTVRNEHANLYHAIMLRFAARVELGEELSEANYKRYQSWKKALEQDNAVFHYEPETLKGFYRVLRRDGIDLGFIRELDQEENDSTKG